MDCADVQARDTGVDIGVCTEELEPAGLLVLINLIKDLNNDEPSSTTVEQN
jgi:hypothetical protein